MVYPGSGGGVVIAHADGRWVYYSRTSRELINGVTGEVVLEDIDPISIGPNAVGWR